MTVALLAVVMRKGYFSHFKTSGGLRHDLRGLIADVIRTRLLMEKLVLPDAEARFKSG
jgi:hypothetical protein